MRRAILGMVLAIAIPHAPTAAMTFRVERVPDGMNVIIGEGPIEPGDAERLESVIPRADRDEYGNIPLYLNSPGGAVKAAFDTTYNRHRKAGDLSGT